MELADKLKVAASKFGFAALGFAKANYSSTIEIYDKWLAAGYAAEMQYLYKNRHLRTHPQFLMSEVKTVIATAARYPTNTNPENGSGFSTCVAMEDYHEVMRRKLNLLCTLIKTEYPHAITRCCVDSAPLLEREWALNAGIGWRGKQGQIIIPCAGACCVLGFILTNIEIESPINNRIRGQCGNCDICRKACPTGAILDNGLLNAQLCISYLTIESKKPIPIELRNKIGNTICGCDRCTATCPYNKTASVPIMPEFTTKKMPTPEECIKMSEEEFNEFFSNTPAWRVGISKLRNNALIAIQNKKC